MLKLPPTIRLCPNYLVLLLSSCIFGHSMVTKENVQSSSQLKLWLVFFHYHISSVEIRIPIVRSISKIPIF
uniref:Uncharacterized protein n=1 Tax=Setaria viridis TaxID=4556 RepID=A0A4U6TFH1_SETVI|nr:hypothetical protein SEVIR_8G033732v2 [Setaria viridis]TKV99298.1 hypothetical protein SEVIR_8G033732v2 [Setaria viridis]